MSSLTEANDRRIFELENNLFLTDEDKKELASRKAFVSPKGEEENLGKGRF